MVAGAKDEDAEMHLTGGSTHSVALPVLGSPHEAFASSGANANTRQAAAASTASGAPVDRVAIVAAVSGSVDTCRP
jgi:hypothetical protein